MIWPQVVVICYLLGSQFDDSEFTGVRASTASVKHLILYPSIVETARVGASGGVGVGHACRHHSSLGVGVRAVVVPLEARYVFPPA